MNEDTATHFDSLMQRSNPVLGDRKKQQDIDHGDIQKSYDIQERLTAAVNSLMQPVAKISPEQWLQNFSFSFEKHRKA